MERENQQPAALTALHLALQVGTICHLEAADVGHHQKGVPVTPCPCVPDPWSTLHLIKSG